MKDLVKIFKALSNIKRLEIFEILLDSGEKCAQPAAGGETSPCVTALAAKVNLSQPTVSHHLKELCNAGLIEMDKDGLWVHCRVNRSTLKIIRDFLDRN